MTIAYSLPNILILLKVLPLYVTMVTELDTYLSEMGGLRVACGSSLALE